MDADKLPELGKEAFHCPHCGVYASQAWWDLGLKSSAAFQLIVTDMCASRCAHCERNAYWHGPELILPRSVVGPAPAADMPDDVRDVYEEARQVFQLSPKSAAALLRLGVQKLMVALGEKGKNINEDIGKLVEKGLPVQVQKALDIVRLVANGAVHPGEINLDEEPEKAFRLFGLLNFIVHDRITNPRQIDEFFNELPEGGRKQIEQRDSPKVPGNGGK